MNRPVFALAVALFVNSSAAHAQQILAVSMTNGTVTLTAHNVSVIQILREWARVGNVQITNIDKVPGSVVALELTAVPERDALSAILRGVSGYVLGARPAGAPGLAVFDRVAILPVSTAPMPSPSTAVRAIARPVEARPSSGVEEADFNGTNVDAPQTTSGAVTAFVGPENRPPAVPRQAGSAGTIPPQVAAPVPLSPPVAPWDPRMGTRPTATSAPPVPPTPTPFFNGSVGSGQPGAIAPSPQPADTRPSAGQGTVNSTR